MPPRSRVTFVDLDALAIYRYYKARFQIEFLCRDAKQFTGLTDSHVHSQAKLNFHFNASLTAVTLAKLEARQHNAEAASEFSMASLKRRAFKQHLIERISRYLAKGHSLEKSSSFFLFVAYDLCPTGPDPYADIAGADAHASQKPRVQDT